MCFSERTLRDLYDLCIQQLKHKCVMINEDTDLIQFSFF